MGAKWADLVTWHKQELCCAASARQSVLMHNCSLWLAAWIRRSSALRCQVIGWSREGILAR